MIVLYVAITKHSKRWVSSRIFKAKANKESSLGDCYEEREGGIVCPLWGVPGMGSY